MRIGLISQEYPPETAKGGIGTQTCLKAHGLTALGHEVVVISRSTDGQRVERDERGVHVIRIPSTPMSVFTELADWLSYSQRVSEEIAAEHSRKALDILDFPEWACEGYVHLLNRSKWNRIPTVIQLHGPLIMLARTLGWPDTDSEFFKVGTQMESTTLRLADAVYSSSACSADWCAREYGLDRDRIPVMHTGIDRDLFHPLSVTKAAEPTIVFVGKMVRNKGVELLVEAACEVADDFPELRLRLLGGGEKSIIESVRKKVAERNLAHMLDMPGYVERYDLPEQLSRAHIFAAPSMYEGGPGFVYLEAMACGLPVIACLGSGAAEIIRDGENGLLIPPDDVSALGAALRRLLCNRAEMETMAVKAQMFVRHEADSKFCVDRIATYYQAVIAEGRALQARQES